jgi:hypothetical protein
MTKPRQTRTTVFFVRGLPVHLRDRLTDEAKRRGVTVGRLLTDILAAALPTGKTATTIEDRIAQLERAVAELRGHAPSRSRRRR